MNDLNNTDYASYLEFLKHISEIASKSDSIKSFLESTVNLIKSVLNTERCSILLREKNFLKMGASSGIPKDEWETIKIPVGKGVAGKVASENKAYLIEDIDKSIFVSSHTNKQQTEKYTTNSFITVPLSFKDKNLGVISVTNPIGRDEFNEDDLSLLLALSNYIALSLENSKLLIDNCSMREYLNNIIESLPVGILSLNDDLDILQYNQVAKKLLNISFPKSENKINLRDALPKDIVETIILLISSLTENQDIANKEAIIKNPIDQSISLNMMIIPMKSSLGTTLKDFIIIFEDLTLKKEVSELHRINEIKNNFISMVSHELKTPLTSIKGAIHLLTSSLSDSLPEQIKELIKIVSTNTERLIKLVRDMLDVSNIENQTLYLMKRSDDLKQIILNVISEYSDRLEKKNLGTYFDYKTPIREVPMDSERIKSVIHDLVDNAYKYTDKGGSIYITVWDEEGKIKISVKDTGIGVDPGFAEKIFDKFFQVENTITRSIGGAGLGLFLARTLLRLHGGDIVVNQNYINGAEFIVTLPIIADEEQAARIVRKNINETKNSSEEDKNGR